MAIDATTKAKILAFMVTNCRVETLSVPDFRAMVVNEFPEAEAEWDTLLTFDFIPMGAKIKLENDVQVMAACPVVASPSPESAVASEAAVTEGTTKRPWPPTEPERFAAVRDALIEHVEKNDHATAAAIQDEFARVGEKRIKEILDTLVALGVAQENNGKYSHSA